MAQEVEKGPANGFLGLVPTVRSPFIVYRCANHPSIPTVLGLATSPTLLPTLSPIPSPTSFANVGDLSRLVLSRLGTPADPRRSRCVFI
jgi:hypothetical protein